MTDIVHQRVEAPVPTADDIGERRHVGCRSGIARDYEPLIAESGAQLLRPRRVDLERDDRRTQVGKGRRRGAPDARATAGDKHHLAREVDHCASCSRRRSADDRASTGILILTCENYG
ncbi:hypothetical protein MSIM_35210 [Mycobacterium simiae]|nr:hypothetical protein MSIM_35210 [Mycobacterium simiae]